MTIGKDGQMSIISFTGVLFVQTSRRPRRRGDPKTTSRHLRQTCTSVCHSSIHSASFLKTSNISRRATSGSISIVTWPIVYVNGCCRVLHIRPHVSYFVYTVGVFPFDIPLRLHR